MKILFITAHKYLPQMYGGLQTSTDELCHSLMSRGHQVAVLAGLMQGGIFALTTRIKIQVNKRFLGRKASRDTGLGYPVWRSWLPWEAVESVCDVESPDVIVVMTMHSVRMALAAKETGIPILMQLMDVLFHDHDGNFGDLGKVACIANSHFTADTYRRAFGVEPIVIYPFISADRYQTQSTRENVTFINPVRQKGLDIVAGIAQLCPNIPFSWVEAWPLSAEERQRLMQKLSSLPNVTLLPPQKDMRSVYSRAKILLAPSLVEEAYGRVVTEAQFSGIPAIASNRGGLPEAVGPGGLLFDPEGSIEVWAEAVRSFWDDASRYGQMSAAAKTYSQRPEISQSYQMEATEKALLAAMHRQELSISA